MLGLKKLGFSKISKFSKFSKFYFQFIKLRKMSEGRVSLLWRNRYPCLDDNTSYTGFDRHYIYHPAWAFRLLNKTQPDVHVDISSTLAFCSLASAIFNIEFYDFRPPNLELDNLKVESQNILKLSFPDNSIKSLSCMHVVEHIGLGRYGDELDIDGDMKAISELARVLAIGGNLFFVVPVAKRTTVHFNAHRVYEPRMIIEKFAQKNIVLNEFVLIPENEKDGGLILNPSTTLLETQNYGCGCFWFTKKEM